MTATTNGAIALSATDEASRAYPGSRREGATDGVDPRTYVRDKTWASDPITLRRTLRLLRSDYQRMADHYHFPLTFGRAVQMTILPAIIALIVHRFSHLFYMRGFHSIGWLLYTFNNFATGCDIVPRTKIGERCLLGHSIATILSGQIGRNATILARVGVGGGRDGRDIGAGPGLPIVGDDVIFGVNSSTSGSLFIGDGAFIGAHSLVLRDVPPNAIVTGCPARVTRFRDDVPAEEGGRTLDSITRTTS